MFVFLFKSEHSPSVNCPRSRAIAAVVPPAPNTVNRTLLVAGSSSGVCCIMSDAAERNRRSRQREKQGLSSHDLDLPDTAHEGVIDGLVYFGELTEREAEDDKLVAEAQKRLAQGLLIWFGQHWREMDRDTALEIVAIRVSRDPSKSEA